jgi:biotin synthase
MIYSEDNLSYMSDILAILQKPELNQQDIICLLGLQGAGKTMLFEQAARIKQAYMGNKVYFRGLIEFSNICHKNCLYCGIRHDNSTVNRYQLSDEEVLTAARYAFENNYGSIVLQSGELDTGNFIRRVEKILQGIQRITRGNMRVTLSCGEQDEETYRRWYESGAQRYLLRIESSNQELYRKLHPMDHLHEYRRRLECLFTLQKIGYQVGTGVMIGLPFQTLNDLADDLLFMKQFDIDMVGMGPYLEHEHTPFFAFHDQLMPREERFQLTLKMIAVLRILMKDINIAATTALQAIDKLGREKGLKAGANVIMPNITPGKYRDDYLLYQDKPCTDEHAEDCKNCLEARVALAEHTIAYGEFGDSLHFRKKEGTRDQGQGTSQH